MSFIDYEHAIMSMLEETGPLNERAQSALNEALELAMRTAARIATEQAAAMVEQTAGLVPVPELARAIRQIGQVPA